MLTELFTVCPGNLGDSLICHSDTIEHCPINLYNTKLQDTKTNLIQHMRVFG